MHAARRCHQGRSAGQERSLAGRAGPRLRHPPTDQSLAAGLRGGHRPSPCQGSRGNHQPVTGLGPPATPVSSLLPSLLLREGSPSKLMSRCPRSPLWGKALGSPWRTQPHCRVRCCRCRRAPWGCHIRASTGTGLSVQVLPGDRGQGSVPEGLAPVCAWCGCQTAKGAGVRYGDGCWHLPGKIWAHRFEARPSAMCLAHGHLGA